MQVQLSAVARSTFSAPSEGDGLEAHSGGESMIWQLISASHPGRVTDPSEVNLKVNAPAGLDAIISPGLLVPSKGLPGNCGAIVDSPL